MSITITLQYFGGCPNWQIAEREIWEAVRKAGLEAEVSYQKVESHDEAERLEFRGSPTILVSGADPFADEDAPVGLSCRVYWIDGKPSGSPGVAALEQVLRAEP